MIVPQTRTFTAGELETAAYLNSSVSAVGNFLLGKPVFSAYSTATTALSATATLLPLANETIDRDNGHSTVTNTDRYTSQTAGWYFVSGAIGLAGNAAATTDILRTRSLTINNNGSAGGGAVGVGRLISSTASVTVTAEISTLMYLNVGDYISLQAYCGTGATGTLAAMPYTGATAILNVIWVSS
jgi:hypothetical protein